MTTVFTGKCYADGSNVSIGIHSIGFEAALYSGCDARAEIILGGGQRIPVRLRDWAVECEAFAPYDGKVICFRIEDSDD